MNEEKVQELLELGLTIEEVEDTYDIIKELAEGELQNLLYKCFKL